MHYNPPLLNLLNRQPEAVFIAQYYYYNFRIIRQELDRISIPDISDRYIYHNNKTNGSPTEQIGKLMVSMGHDGFAKTLYQLGNLTRPERKTEMDNFIYSIPTTAYFGKGQISILGETLKAHGASKVLLAYGGGSIKKNGIYNAVIEQLTKAGISHR